MSYALCFSKKAFSSKNALEGYIKVTKSCLEAEKLIVFEEPTPPKSDKVILRVRAPREIIEIEAQTQGLFKRNAQTGLLDQFVIANATETFENYTTKIGAAASIEDLETPFWLPCEELHILHAILHSVKANPDLNNFLSSKCRKVQLDESLLHVSIRSKVLEELVPLHTGNGKCKKLWKNIMWKPVLTDEIVTEIFNYFGAQVGLYFAWMEHFTLWLCAPGLIGGIVWLHNYLDDDVSMDTSKLAPYFTIFLICWAVLFVQYWKRKCAALSCDWGTSGETIEPQVRADFIGELRTSPITGKQERFYPFKQRLLKYTQSAIVTTGMLLVAFCVMLISLNFQGYIHQNSYGAKWIHFPCIQQFSVPGAIFDQQGGGKWPMVLPFVPTIVHALTIMQLNLLYRSIAVKLTEAENHQTQQNFENALIVKRFLFEAFDCYIALFFLAFIQVDIVLLRAELVSLYTADSARRVITESILPLLMQTFTQKHTVHKAKKTDTCDVALPSPLLEEVEKDEYEQFDDYLEMVIQFGYVTLFASAFPLAGLLSIVCNLIEIKSDFFKLTHVVRRPHSVSTDNIGTWLSVLSGMVWLSIATNVFIFAFTTEQMMQVFPSMFKIISSEDVDFGGSDHGHALVLGQGRWVVGIAVLFEHLLFLLAILVTSIIPDIPWKVRSELKRREYRHAQIMTKQTIK